MMHLENLMAKGAEVENQVKSRINQCDELKDWMRVPGKEGGVFEESGDILPLKGFSLESKRKGEGRD